MLGAIAFCVVAIALAATANAEPQVIYGGYNHVLVFDGGEKIVASVYDYLRGQPSDSKCSAIYHPALVKNTTMHDWLASNGESYPDLSFNHLGYELFLVQNKRSGQYVLRRCTNFGPHVRSLPCDPFASGVSAKLKRPFKSVFVGHDRVMLINELTNEYGIYAYDGDVQNGADPFHFSQPPLFHGVMLSINNISSTDFAFVTLKNYGGELLVAHDSSVGRMMGFSIRAHVRSESLRPINYIGEKLLESRSPIGTHMSMMGENQVMFYSPTLDYQIWSFSLVSNATRNRTSVRVIGNVTYHGSLKKGHTCLKANLSSCMAAHGCAWCASSRSCHPFDSKYQRFCQQHVCVSEDRGVSNSESNQKVVPPPSLTPTSSPSSSVTATPSHEPTPSDSFTQSHSSSTSATPSPSTSPPAVFDNEESSSSEEEPVADDPNLPHDYRDQGPDTPVVKPIHPDLDNNLGHEPLVVDEDNPEDVLLEKTRIGQGEVFVPPPPSDKAPCMDDGYDPQGRRVNIGESTRVMNTITGAKLIVTSPNGDAAASHQEQDPVPKGPHSEELGCDQDMNVEPAAPITTANATASSSAVGQSNPPRVRRIERSPPSPIMDKGKSLLGDQNRETAKGGNWMETSQDCGGFSCTVNEESDSERVDLSKPQNEEIFEQAMNNEGTPDATWPKTAREHKEMFAHYDNVQDFIPLPHPSDAPVHPPSHSSSPSPSPSHVGPQPTNTPTPTPTNTPFLPVQPEMHNNHVSGVPGINEIRFDD